MNHFRQFVITLLFILMTAFPAMAGNGMNHGMQAGMGSGQQMQQGGMGMGNQMHKGMDMGQQMKQGGMENQMHEGMNMDKNAHGNMNMMGTQIRTASVDGYEVAYHVMDMHAQMPDNPEMAGTYHLMVSFKDSTGKPVTSATVGYLVKGPDGKTQKAMAMTMGKSFGANLKLTEKGEYAITAKALIGDKKVIDRFTYALDQ
ncbi:MAG: hypothetical protein GXP53_08690 [Deltaproteobacteria bacterium]|nr:hypothetical protein [Deltaproteobacteria bacterium]